LVSITRTDLAVMVFGPQRVKSTLGSGVVRVTPFTVVVVVRYPFRYKGVLDWVETTLWLTKNWTRWVGPVKLQRTVYPLTFSPS
jgi:hypothetical protein